MKKPTKTTPKFATEAQERAFWEQHDSIKAAANSRDVPYQSLIKVWLQEKLHSH